jgi:DNA mismatch repair ATPase MutS
VEDLNERPELRDALWEQLKSLPDLERAISRIHAGRATTLQFISVLEAFYQIWVRSRVLGWLHFASSPFKKTHGV